MDRPGASRFPADRLAAGTADLQFINEGEASLRTITKWIVPGSLVAAVVIQFYPQLERENPPLTGEIEAPAEVVQILRTSCYDCHSNQTRWPWYSRVAPMSWLVAHDVREGRSRVNFSTWSKDLPSRYQGYFIDRAVERVVNGEMPPRRYLLLHSSAKIEPGELETLQRWRSTENLSALK